MKTSFVSIFKSLLNELSSFIQQQKLKEYFIPMKLKNHAVTYFELCFH